MRSLEVVVRQDIVSRTLMILGVLSVLAALPGADEVMGQAHPGVVPGRPAAPATAPADPNAPKLRCDETTFDFGDAWSGDVVEHGYVIHNDGKSPLELLGVRSSCGCTVVDYDKVVAPGGEGKVTVKLTVPKAFQPQPVTKTVSVESNDPAKKLTTLTIKGKTKPRVSLEPFNAAFGNVTEDADVTRVIKVTNNTEGHMKLEQIPLPPGQKTVFKAEITEVEPGKVAEIKITGVRPFAERSNSTVLQFNTGLEKEGKISITCSLYSPPLLEASPSLLPLFVPVTREFVRQVSINYNGKEDFKIESAVPGHEQVKLELTPVQGSKSFRLIVRVPEGFTPPSDDPIDIILKTNIQQKPELKVSLKPTRMPAQVQRPQPQAPAAVARAEDLLGKPTPVTSQVPLAGGQAVQIGTNNQPAVLNFWAAWSPQSRRQLPLMRTLYNLYARKGVSFLNISVDSLKPVGEVLEAARQAGLADVTLASDPRYTTAARFGIKQVPTVFLIGKNGQVEAVHEGLPAAEQMAVYEQMLKKEIDVLLEGGGRAAFGDVPKPTTSADALEPQSPGAPPLASTPKLTIESARQDLGAVKPASKVTARLYYRNDGMQPLTIQSATASEGFAISPDYAKTLSPGAMAVLACSFDSAAQPGPFEHKVTLATNDPTRPKLDIVLTGSVRPYLECDPKTGIDFGRDPRKHTMGRLATILYNGGDEIEYLSAECSSPKFEPTVTKLAGGQSAKLVVNPKPPFELGELNATIKVTTTCKQQPVIEVPVRLFVPKRIEVTPEAIVVEGPRRTRQFNVTIANNGLENLSILGVTRSSNLIRTRFYPSDEDGRSYKLEVTLPFSYVPPAGGDNITIRTDDKEFGEIVIPIRGATGG